MASVIDAEALERDLRASVEGEVRFDRVTRAVYATDASVYQIIPAGVVIPKSRDDVLRVVEVCRRHGVSITARGGGTSQAGQAIGAGIQLDFSKYLNRVLEVNAEEGWVRLEPGIVLDHLNDALKPYGLQLPLDISTSDRATVGGMLANNSAGTRSVVYGKTLDYVQELTVLLSDGTVAQFGQVSSTELEAHCGKSDLEGECYRTVRRLAAEHAAEIRARYPRILRRVGGYNLDSFLDDGAQQAPPGFNLARMVIGSEGTLVLVLEARLRVVPLPPARAVCVVHFHDLLESLAATPVILAHRPSAVELMDRFILDSTRGKTDYEPLRDFIAGDPAAVLVVEFFHPEGRTLDEVLDGLEADLRQRGLGYHFHRAVAPAAQARIWKLRRAALGLTMAERGDTKAISFVEDTAVAPERLRDYIERFLEILARHATQAGFYAHASVGLLHVRPAVNLKTARGVAAFKGIATEIADLVLEFGGALSGEHGDGLVRAPFQEKMFGPVLYQAFREIKHAFDPHGLFNPGKIVDAPPLEANLRFGAAYAPLAILTTFDFGDYGGFGGAAEQCGGVGECRKSRAGTMCPSYMATRDEIDSTRGRANALRLAASGQLGPAGLAEPELMRVLDLCLECKACKTECPTGVDMARMKAEVLHQQHRKHGVPLRSRLLGHVGDLAPWASRCAPLVNAASALAPLRALAESVLGLERRRLPPRFSSRPFDTSHTARGGTASGKGEEVALFADTFSNYSEPEILRAAAELITLSGASLVVPPRTCCGRPQISKGLLEAARVRATATVRALLPLAERGVPIVFCEPSCYSAVRDDYPHLLTGELKRQALTVAGRCLTFEEWAGKVFREPGRMPTLLPGPPEVLHHGHCHQKALVGTRHAVSLLGAIPGCRVTDLDSGCCGMAGSFGYEKEHFEVSRQIGELRLLPAVRGRAAHSAVVASGFSCRHQVHQFTDAVPVHPAVLLRSLLPK